MTRPATSDFDPTAIASIPKTHNQSPFDALVEELNDLYEEAKNFCDGQPIDSDAMADAITELHDRIHECGKRAEELRVAEKKPLDDKIAEIQTKFHPLIGNTKAGKGKVVLGKDACQSLLTPWRNAKRLAAEAEAARIAAEAETARQAANAAMQSSSGNLAAREEAEAALADAKRLEKQAGRATKAATTGTGLRTVWVADIVDEEAALEWCWARAKDEFLAVVQRNADECVRGGLRAVPGFVVREEKVAR